MSGPVIVTIDGPAGVGKSTLARAVAQALGLPYLDTGAMFRTLAFTLCSLQGGCSERLPAPVLRQAFDTLHFALEGVGGNSRLLCNGKPMGPEIRTEEVGAMAAAIAVEVQVRDFLKERQQALAATTSLVAEGRDMGTVIFPHAACKFFLDAAPEVRALRRQAQLREQGREEDLEKLVRQIRERDAVDRNRAVAPLRPAADAEVVDTSTLTQEEVLAAMLTVLRRKGFSVR